MNKVLQFIDSLIEKIPVHIRDIIQKAFITLASLAGLMAVVYGIKLGAQKAQPGGMQIFGQMRDMLYRDQILEENKNKIELQELPLSEDIDDSSRPLAGDETPDFHKTQEAMEGFDAEANKLQNVEDHMRTQEGAYMEERPEGREPAQPETQNLKDDKRFSEEPEGYIDTTPQQMQTIEEKEETEQQPQGEAEQTQKETGAGFFENEE